MALAQTVTATNGRVADTTIDYVVSNSGASFTGPVRALTNAAVTFDGSPSAIPYSSSCSYVKWVRYLRICRLETRTPASMGISMVR
jgi:hypothetical protein